MQVRRAGWRMTAVAAVASVTCVAASGGSAAAQSLPFDGARTPQWFADHPAERAQVRRACLNDPARLGPTPDCVNANRGDAIQALRESGDSRSVNDPSSPGYWSQRPSDRAVKLAYCNRMMPEHQARADCGPAQESLRLEQQRGSGN